METHSYYRFVGDKSWNGLHHLFCALSLDTHSF
jgi:hypothetical protein